MLNFFWGWHGLQKLTGECILNFLGCLLGEALSVQLYLIYNFAVTLPVRVSVSYMFNLGSFLGITLVSQVVSGFLLVLNYNTLQRYERVSYIVREVHLG